LQLAGYTPWWSTVREISGAGESTTIPLLVKQRKGLKASSGRNLICTLPISPLNPIPNQINVQVILCGLQSARKANWLLGVTFAWTHWILEAVDAEEGSSLSLLLYGPPSILPKVPKIGSSISRRAWISMRKRQQRQHHDLFHSLLILLTSFYFDPPAWC
jgi:hypothetical protein